MTDVKSEHIRWIYEAFRPDREGVYPTVPGTVKGSRTSEAAAASLSEERRLTHLQWVYTFVWHRPNHECIRQEIVVFLRDRLGLQTNAALARTRDCVLRCWLYETGEMRTSTYSGQPQEVVRCVGEPVEPEWGDPDQWRVIAETFHRMNKDGEKAVIQIIEIMKDWK